MKKIASASKSVEAKSKVADMSSSDLKKFFELNQDAKPGDKLKAADGEEHKELIIASANPTNLTFFKKYGGGMFTVHVYSKLFGRSEILVSGEALKFISRQ